MAQVAWSCWISWGAVSGGLVLLLANFGGRSVSPTWNKMMDLGHVPLFALLCLAIWVLTQRAWLTFGVSVMLACIVECLQGFVGRSASIQDFFNGVAGCLLPFIWLGRWPENRWFGTPCRLGLSFAALMAPTADALPVFGHAAWARQRFPILSDFRWQFQRVAWKPRQAEFNLLSRQAVSENLTRPYQAQLRFMPGPDTFSGVEFVPEVRDWSNYRFLVIELELVEVPATLHLSIRDFRDETTEADRYEVAMQYPRGKHTLRIDLAEVAQAPRSMALDLKNIFSLVIWDYAPEQSWTLDLYGLRLE